MKKLMFSAIVAAMTFGTAAAYAQDAHTPAQQTTIDAAGLALIGQFNTDISNKAFKAAVASNDVSTLSRILGVTANTRTLAHATRREGMRDTSTAPTAGAMASGNAIRAGGSVNVHVNIITVRW